MSAEPIQLIQQQEQQENHIAHQEDDVAGHYHPISNLLNYSQKIYNQYPRLHIQPIENTVKKMNLNKISSFIDKQFDSTISLIIPVKDKVVEHSQNLRDNLIEKSKLATLVKKADSISATVLDHLENQVQFLETLIRNHNKGFAAENGANEEQQQLENSDDQKSDHHKKDASDLHEDKPSGLILKKDAAITDRTKRLAERVNNVSILLAQASMSYLRSFRAIDSICNVYGSVQGHGSKYYRHVKAHVLVMQEISLELFNNYVWSFLNENYVKPTQQAITTCVNEKKEQVTIIVKNVQSYAAQQVWPNIQKKYVTLKESTVYFYQNQLKIDVAKEFFQQNYERVQKEVLEAYEDLQKYQVKLQQKTINLYQTALQMYRDKLKLKQFVLENKLMEIDGEYEEEEEEEEILDDADNKKKQLNLHSDAHENHNHNEEQADKNEKKQSFEDE